MRWTPESALSQKDNTEIDLETIDKAIDKLKESIEKIKKEKKFNNDD